MLVKVFAVKINVIFLTMIMTFPNIFILSISTLSLTLTNKKFNIFFVTVAM